ncbi:DUF1294 domain-containing protein [Massilia rubra]|nr:DUF1294 domain-containing protein [Massilia rubra]
MEAEICLSGKFTLFTGNGCVASRRTLSWRFFTLLPMPYLSILLFGAVFAGAVLAWHVPLWAGALYLPASVVCFVVYARDKAAARAAQRRTPERTLLLLGLLCGWPGAVLAQQWLRHKSSKRPFQMAFWATVLCNMAAFVYLVSPLSFVRML